MNNEEVEIWKIHEDSDLLVSNMGRVKGKYRTFLKLVGRPYVSVSSSSKLRNNKRISFFVHRLVWESFNHKIPTGKVINHKNYDKTDNRLCNLECISVRENNRHGQLSPVKIIPLNDRIKAKTSLLKEEWRFNQFVKRYISNFGRVKLKGRKSKQFSYGRPNAAGYMRFSLNGKDIPVHRLVWESFHGKIPKGMVINHKDGIKHNNYLDNLECVTFQQNAIHSIFTLGNICTPEDRFRKLTAENVKQICHLLNHQVPIRLIGKFFNVNYGAISGISQATTWALLAKKYLWKFNGFKNQKSLYVNKLRLSVPVTKYNDKLSVTYDSIRKASLNGQINRKKITNAIKNKTKHLNFYWKYGKKEERESVSSFLNRTYNKSEYK